jgi:hypothetical protein
LDVSEIKLANIKQSLLKVSALLKREPDDAYAELAHEDHSERPTIVVHDNDHLDNHSGSPEHEDH